MVSRDTSILERVFTTMSSATPRKTLVLNNGKLLVVLILLERWSRAMFGQENTYKHVSEGAPGIWGLC